MEKNVKYEDNQKTEETADSNLEANQEIIDEESKGEQSEELKEKIEAIMAENEELKAKYLRLNADFQNLKKRVEKEKSDIYSYANESLIVELLPILDNFERAVESAANEDKEESIKKGIEMIQQQMLDVLGKNGVCEIPAMGEAFDHNMHHAVLQEEHPDYDANIVIDVLQKGYTLNGKVVRPSMVKVSK